MDTCRHRKLILIKQDKNKLRCTHCHLTINEDELDTDYCPECWETDRGKRRAFERVEQEESDTEVYRCEECGAEIRIQ